MRKTIASVVVIFMCLFMFAGCRPKSIEEAIKPADLQKMDQTRWSERRTLHQSERRIRG